MDKTKPKILGNLEEETHKEVVKLKAELGHKNIDTTLNFLLDVYKEKINKELEAKENIINSNLKQEDNI